MYITDENAFKLFIEDICKDSMLSVIVAVLRRKTGWVPKKAFKNFLKVQVFISNKIFLSLENNPKDEYINKENTHHISIGLILRGL